MRRSSVIPAPLALALFAILTSSAGGDTPRATRSGAPIEVWTQHEDEPGKVRLEAQRVVRSPESPTRATATGERAALYVVTDAGDAPDDSIEDGVFFPPTLRAAIQNVSYFGGTNTIQFDPGITQIDVLSAMPFASATVTIDGGDPRVILDGSAIAPTGFAENGFAVAGGASGSVIQNLEITGFPDAAIFVGAQSVEIYNCVLHDNRAGGILGNAARFCQIGGTLPDLKNVIYNNTSSSGDGIQLILASHDNLILGNYLGTPDGFTDGGNSRRGIQIQGNRNRVEANVILGNDYGGTRMGDDQFQPSTANHIFNNLIGVTADGTDTVGNGDVTTGPGISIRYGESDTISYNLIGGNAGYGIEFGNWGNRAHIYNNVIGLDSAETASLGNRIYGALLRGNSNLIDGNVIGGNFSSGLIVQGDSNMIAANVLGFDAPGPPYLGNGLFGVSVDGNHNTVGGPTPADGNIISGNTFTGVAVTGSGSTGNIVQNNLIGTDHAGLLAVPNGSGGVAVWDSATGTEIRDNLIGGNNWAGIFVGQAFNRRPRGTVIEGNLIGFVGIDTLGNVGDGIRIDKAVGTIIGAIVPNPGFNDIKFNGGNGIYLVNADSTVISGDTICFNDGAGVRIDTGLSNYVAHNSIVGNGGLGIDLGGDGITPNDSLDLDAGPNGLLNSPVIDSGYVNDTTSTSMYGAYQGRPNEMFTLDFNLNTECDSLRYGEGERWIDSAVVVTDADGHAAWQLQVFEIVDSGNVITMTATDSLGNTSEFSACWPFKIIRVVDSKSNPITQRELVFSRVAYDPPTYTETLIDTFRTDEFGRVYLSAQHINVGDSLQVQGRIDAEAAFKHPALLGTMYTNFLDNAVFDSITFNMSFDELDTALTQEVKLGHHTVRFNLLVSIEWDATPAYVANLEEAFRKLSNYLYDVFDGQLQLDTIAIFDDRWLWKEADVHIHANNVEWPRAHADGIYFADSLTHITLPRIWFGDPSTGRDWTAQMHPLNPADPWNYRTIGHEFGHYALGFRDEYLFPYGLKRCASIANYGYMDSQYPSSDSASSELSSGFKYLSIECKNNKQYRENKQSCWGYFEKNYQRDAGPVHLPILHPLEQARNGADYFLGPNDDTLALDYDVGRLVTFIGTTAPYHTAPRFLTVTDHLSLGLDRMFVIHHRVSTNRLMVQGQSATDGRMIALGVEVGDSFFVGGVPGTVTVDSSALRRTTARAADFDWYYGIAAASAASDSINIQLQPVQGEYPLVVSVNIGASDVDVAAQFVNAFDAPPSLQHWPDGVLGGEDALSVAGDDYTTTLSSSTSDIGTMRFWAVDSAAQSYFFDVDYAVEAPNPGDSSGVHEIRGRGGDAEVDIDTTAGTVDRMMLASCAYPVIRSGLDPGALQAGRAHALASYPLTSFAGFGSLSLFYDDTAVKDSVGGWDLETTLQLYRWDDVQNEWSVIGGEVDTAFNVISAAIDEPGVYAAFTTEVPCPIGMTGDVNLSGTIVSSDIVYLVNYVFKAGPAPLPCVAAGDVNCDGKVAASDLIYLVNYVLKAGAAPCDACTLVPGVWNCP